MDDPLPPMPDLAEADIADDIRFLTASGPGVAGVDEVGRGPLAGPVLAAAVVLGDADVPGLADSKTLALAERERLYGELTALARAGRITIGLGLCSACEIDRINIRAASLLAMAKAVSALRRPPLQVLVDGNVVPKGLPAPATAIVGGDGKVAAIAAASIVAKVVRDRMMARLGELHTPYGWAQNVGYSTPFHLESLRRHGPCDQHRMSFKPVRLAALR
ncbi:ribonuclease HII [Marinivivus vitaminiproducens]|uniref:ribonuclease HII n=1 Tax=Marinivivus vitaminiproducens TaxID=3035935 RepID=UPI0027A183AB|nr:ribonuclease HII [Geminicoccaceae bacterium SCSIO 64248]